MDVVGVLTEQPDIDGARNYWKVLKNRLKEEGSQLVTNCNQLKMRSPKDGKRYNTDVANTEQLLRLMPHPYGTGSYILEVEDAFLPEVSGRWQVTYADGKATAVARTGAYPDLVVDETTASQLVLGRIGLADALYRPDTQVLRNVENLQRVFTRRTVHLAL